MRAVQRTLVCIWAEVIKHNRLVPLACCTNRPSVSPLKGAAPVECKTNTPARAPQLHRQIGVFAYFNVLSTDLFKCSTAERTKSIRQDRKNSKRILDNAAKRNADRVFDGLVAGDEAGGCITYAEAAADGAHARVGKIPEQFGKCASIESGVDVGNDDNIAGAGGKTEIDAALLPPRCSSRYTESILPSRCRSLATSNIRSVEPSSTTITSMGPRVAKIVCSANASMEARRGFSSL
jgi:hypothetical protein